MNIDEDKLRDITQAWPAVGHHLQAGKVCCEENSKCGAGKTEFNRAFEAFERIDKLFKEIVPQRYWRKEPT